MSDAKPEATPAPAAKKSKLVPILLIVNSALMVGVLAVMVLRPAGASGATAKPSEGHAAKPEKEDKGEEHGKEGGVPAVGPTLKMADFVIHLRNPEAERYARLALELELGNDLDKERMTPYLPRLRDAFISYFTDRTVEELTGSEALARTKQELFKKVEELVPGKRVRALYITDFVVQ